jgi:hypothetical protein
MSVFLNSTPQEDGAILAAGATAVGIPYESNLLSYREESLEGTPQWLNLVSGGQYVGVWDAYGTYLETGDTGYSFRWKFWARGTGTVALTQDTDPSGSTSTLPSTSIGNLVVDSVDWAIYHVTAGAIVLADFLDYDGIRLGFTGSSGDVDITTCQLECVPDGATYGWWRSEATDPIGPANVTGRVRSKLVDSGYSTDGVTAGNRPTAWNNARDDLLAQDILSQAGSAASPNTTLAMYVYDWARVFGVPGPFEQYGANFNAGVQKQGIQAPLGSPTPDGTEGEDYIRLPGYTLYDSEPYVRDAGNHNNLAVPFFDWSDPHLVLYRDLGSFQTGDYQAIGLEVWVWLLEGYVDVASVPNSWIPDGAPMWVITPADADELTSIEIDLPSAGAFTVYAVSSNASLETDDWPHLPNPEEDAGVQFAGGIWLQSGADVEVNVHPGLAYMKYYNAYSVWDPNATPPGGKLKVWLPSEEWRIIGDEAGSDTERLKMHTPDLTWWKEYRSSDGAVPVHPLKLYTADGWVIATMMTPD